MPTCAIGNLGVLRHLPFFCRGAPPIFSHNSRRADDLFQRVPPALDCRRLQLCWSARLSWHLTRSMRSITSAPRRTSVDVRS
jgi:hypothetical protein